jgi:NAD(P)H dehydrogenase (quinone)
MLAAAPKRGIAGSDTNHHNPALISQLQEGSPMANTRVLVTGATGRIGGAVAVQLLEKGVPIRALVHRDDARSARLRVHGAEVVVADMFDIQQVQAALEGVGRLYFNPPYHPHALDSAVAFAVAARRSDVEVVVALGQWLASPEHPSLMTRQAWLTDKLFELLPDTAHVAVDPGYFADNYLNLVPMAAQLGVLPTPTGAGRNAPPSNEDIARAAVGALLDPHRHDGRAYRPTGPTLLSGADIADAVGEALGRRVRHIDTPPWMFMKAVRVNANRPGADLFFESSLRHYLPEYALGTWEVGGPTTHVRDVAGVEPEDFLTIARRYVSGPESRRTASNLIRQIGRFMLTGLVRMHRLDRFDRVQQHPRPAHPRLSGQSTVWRNEHTAGTDSRLRAIDHDEASTWTKT